MGWLGAGGLTSVSPAPSAHCLRGFHREAGAGQGPVEPGSRGDEGYLCGGQSVFRLGQAGELGLGLWSCTWGFNQLIHTKPVSCSYQ